MILKINNIIFKNVWLKILIISFLGCQSDSDITIPEQILDDENIQLYPASTRPESEIFFQKEVRFEDDGNWLIGRISSTKVDQQGRVFIADNQKKEIHIFEADGSYIKSIGNEGSGPGEFQFLGEMSIHGYQLFVIDSVLLRVNIFSLETLEFIKTYNLFPVNHQSFEELKGLNPNKHFTITDSLFLIRFIPPRNMAEIHEERFMTYYLQNNNGEIISEQLLKQRDSLYLTATIGGRTMPAAFNFLGKSLAGVTPDGKIYSAWSDDFLIKIQNLYGENEYSFYYPFRNRELNKKHLINRSSEEIERNIIQNADVPLPVHWPAINDIIIDDENRFWVSTIIDADDLFEWWVLEPDGKLQALFTWPGDPYGHYREIQCIINGKLYAREVDEVTGRESIVRYHIEMLKG